MSVLRTCGPFPFLRLAGSESVLGFPFLLVVTSVKDPQLLLTSRLSQCRISRPFLPAPRCCTAATSWPQTKMLSYSSFVPESTVPGRMLTQPGNLLPFPHPPLPLGVFLSAANTGKHKGENALEKCISPWAPHLKGIRVTVWSPIGRRQDL